MHHTPSHIRVLAVWGALGCLLLACSNPSALTQGELAVAAIPPDLHLTNQTALPAYTFVIERGAAAYTDWTPCSDPNACRGLAHGATTVLPYGHIAGYTPAAREAIVYWWHLIPQDGGRFQPDTIRAVIVPL